MNKKALICLGVMTSLFCLAGCGGEAEEAAAPVEALEDLPPAKPMPGEMVRVAGGTVTIGTNEDALEPYLETPEHEVEIAEFEIDIYEVTNFQYREFQLDDAVTYRPEGKWRDFDGMGREDYPVVQVTWEDAGAYCEWAGKRLPTEAEWEHAARGTENYRYPWGNEFNANNANTHDYGVSDVIEVGSIETDKSVYGAYDMMGNVQEWVQNRLRPYPKTRARGDQVSAFRATGIYVVRGASYTTRGSKLGLWTRMGYPAKAQYGQGFRCARDVEGEGDGAQ